LYAPGGSKAGESSTHSKRSATFAANRESGKFIERLRHLAPIESLMQPSAGTLTQ